MRLGQHLEARGLETVAASDLRRLAQGCAALLHRPFAISPLSEDEAIDLAVSNVPVSALYLACVAELNNRTPALTATTIIEDRLRRIVAGCARYFSSACRHKSTAQIISIRVESGPRFLYGFESDILVAFADSNSQPRLILNVEVRRLASSG